MTGLGKGPDDAGEDRSGLSAARLFPIGFGLGAVAALALFFGYRAVVGPDGEIGRAAEAPADAAAPATTAAAAPSADDAAEGYADSAPDAAAATPGDALGGLEALAALGEAGPASAAAGPPSLDDPLARELFGSPVVMVSSSVPRVVVLADGTSLVPGERLPGGHRLVDIRRERILLERDGVESRLLIP